WCTLMAEEYLFPSPEWAKAYCEALNKSEEYRRAGSTWTAGDIMFIIKGLPEELRNLFGGRDSVGFILDLYQGRCRGVEFVEDVSSKSAAFVISANYNVWLDVISGKLHPTTALMTMKLKVEKGNVAILLRYAQAAIAMVNAAQRVPTKYKP
ncbi:MAG: SCP2 sterol-binding domain-containing protein, partial [Pyrodictiaceae archaeon]